MTCFVRRTEEKMKCPTNGFSYPRIVYFSFGERDKKLEIFFPNGKHFILIHVPESLFFCHFHQNNEEGQQGTFKRTNQYMKKRRQFTKIEAGRSTLCLGRYLEIYFYFYEYLCEYFLELFLYSYFIWLSAEIYTCFF